MQIGDKNLSFQIGKLAQAADVSILGRMGDTCVLVTVVVGAETDLGYFPLSIEYVEKLYAGGRIKGSRWVKREGRPSDEAILIGRLIDRSIRPLFPKTYKKQVQVVATLLSVDGENSPDIVASMTVEAAVHMSQIPWNGPISTMRVGYVKMNGDETGSLMINPDEEDQKFSTLDLVVSSSKEKVLMIETKAEIIPDQIIIDGIKMAKAENAKVIEFMQMMRDKYGTEKEEVKVDEKIAEIMKIVENDYHAQIEEYLSHRGDSERNSCSELDGIAAEILEKNPETYTAKQISAAIEKYTYKVTKDNVIDKAKRVDGRKIDQVRDLYIESGVLPRTHGSAIFQRGQTQVLSIATLGAPTLGQLIEGPEGEVAKNYIHHYYMPPYSVGECGRMGTPSRREIGHGALAEKAIEPVLPSQTDFPYAIRVVSEVMSSNGSTSMASTCGSSLALMDAGVPIKSAVAGISVGLFSRSDEEYVLLTDIVGFEDFSGEMDFKIAGTDTGITAIQLDVKNLGLTDKMIDETFVKARTARFAILEQMNAVISKPRKEMSQYAPKVVLLTPPADKIGEIIGPGGKNIKQIISKTQTDINITDDGKVTISGVDKDMVEKAISLIENVYRVVEIGEEHEGEVKRILQFGAFVEFLPGKEGLVHVSKMGKGFVKDAHDVFSVGEKILVKVSQIDSQGRINLEPANKPIDVAQGE
jgi:polyribonucleotide nucleotidyltransferase